MKGSGGFSVHIAQDVFIFPLDELQIPQFLV